MVMAFIVLAFGRWLTDVTAMTPAGRRHLVPSWHAVREQFLRYVLDIWKIEGDVVIVKNVHEKYLALFPDVTESSL